jgi:Gdp/GTP exchange factor required for growth at low temperatures
MLGVGDVVEDDGQIDTPMASHHVIPQRPISTANASLHTEESEAPAAEEYTQHAFALSDVVNEDNQDLEPWPSELAEVTMTIAGEQSAF